MPSLHTALQNKPREKNLRPKHKEAIWLEKQTMLFEKAAAQITTSIHSGRKLAKVLAQGTIQLFLREAREDF